MRIVDQQGIDVTAQRGKWSIEMGVNRPPHVTGLVAGDRLCDNDGAPRFVVGANGTGYVANCPPPWMLLDAAFVSAGLEPVGPG